MELKQIDKQTFDEHTRYFSNSNFFQSSHMGNVLSQRKIPVYYLALVDDKKIIGVALLAEYKGFLNKKIFICNKGFLTDYSNEMIVKAFSKELFTFVKEHNGYKLIIDPNIICVERDIDGKIIENGKNNYAVINMLNDLGFKKSKHDIQVRTNFCLDYNGKDEKQIFSEFKSTTRNLISKSEREGVEIFNIGYDELPSFKKITEYTSKKRGFNDRTLEYYQEMFQSFGSDVVFKIARLNVSKHKEYLNNLKQDMLNKISKIKGDNKKKSNYLFEIENINKKIDKINRLGDGKEYIDLACGMFMLYGTETVYLFSGSYDEYIELGGQYLIQWDIIKYGIKNKYRRHNFFGILTYDDKSSPEYGIYLFKRGFNGYVEELLGEYYKTFGIIGTLSKIKDIITK